MDARITLSTCLAWVLVTVPATSQAGDPSATTDELSATEWVNNMNEALLSARTLRADAQLATRDHRGSGKDIKFELLRWVGEDGVRTILEVEEPESARGLLYEIIAEKGKPLERWVYLPEVDRLRKLVGFKRSDSFLGTEFGYEDLEVIVPEERRRGHAEWVREDGRRLVKVTNPGYHMYERVETRIDPETSLPVRAEFYDRAGALWKVETYGGVVDVGGQPFPTRFEMRDVQADAVSTLYLSNIQVDVPVSASYFSEREVERRIHAPDAGSTEGQ